MIDWRHWHNEPWLIGGLVALGWLWAFLAGPCRRRLAPGTAYPRGHALRFYLALLCFYGAVGSPLDQIGERFLFSAHMLQHQLLIYPAALLFLLGLPEWMIDRLFRPAGVGGIARGLTHPLICILIYTLVISLWHVPSFYDLALRNKTVHVAEHVMFFGAALFYWWPLASPSRLVPARGPAVQMLYLLGAFIAMTPVFAYITFSDDILYPTYEFAPRIFPDFTAANDQLLAGVMMKGAGMIVSLTAFGVAFFRWNREQK
ncbi:MAG: cytochrome c oxidase assembly protein [Opitutaceae bacterium]